MATVSLCMIIRNEQSVLERCLESVKNAVDEIIIVDTGSSDATKDIAARYTDKIYDFEWIDDFSAARNYCFSKSTMEFAMWMDADDYFTDDQLIKFIELKNSIPDNADVIMTRYCAVINDSADFYFYRERMFRNTIDYKWVGRVHESVAHNGRLYYADISIMHKSAKTSYSKRNLNIYEKQIMDGEELSVRDMFYFGRELYYHAYYEKALIVLHEFIDSGKGWIENNIEACKIASYCYQHLDGKTKALEMLTKTFQYDIPRADICCEIGKIFMDLNKYEVAAFWYETALKSQKNEKNGGFILNDCYGYLPCIQLCVCYYKLGDIEKSKLYNEKAGEFKPKSEAYLYNLKFFKSLSSNPS